jgi:hypothetical protein
MNTQGYSRVITVKNTPEAVYEALTAGIEHWWTKPDKPLLKVGDQAKFTFPPGKSFWTFEATVLISEKYVEMTCVDALHLHEGQPKEIEKEWLNTKVMWKIIPQGEYTEIHFTHLGLMPSLLCYEVCQEGWDFFFTDSLKAYLSNGIGMPHAI